MNDNLEIECLMNDIPLLEILNKKPKIEYNELKFNIFELISDKYHRENLHSDILYFFLSQIFFLREFIRLINIEKPSLEIDENNYINSEITKEKYKIDILIKSEKGSFIIIENKLNNAVDMDNQLPRYVDEVGKENVDAILYLPLNPYKEPEKKNWDKWDKQIHSFIDDKLIIIPAISSNENKIDLYNKVLNEWIKISKTFGEYDILTILTHYKDLLLKLGGIFMDLKRIDETFLYLQEKNLMKQSIELYKLVESMKLYLADKLFNFLKEKKLYCKYEGENIVSIESGHYRTIDNAIIDLVIVIEVKIDLNDNSFFYEFRFWQRDNDELTYEKIKDDSYINSNFKIIGGEFVKRINYEIGNKFMDEIEKLSLEFSNYNIN